MADLHTFLHHWQDEADAAYLYRLLATLEPDAKRRSVFERLAEVEDRHTTIWGKDRKSTRLNSSHRT